MKHLSPRYSDQRRRDAVAFAFAPAPPRVWHANPEQTDALVARWIHRSPESLRRYIAMGVPADETIPDGAVLDYRWDGAALVRRRTLSRGRLPDGRQEVLSAVTRPADDATMMELLLCRAHLMWRRDYEGWRIDLGRPW